MSVSSSAGLGGQSYENDGLNNNLGFVVTDEGVLVIGRLHGSCFLGRTAPPAALRFATRGSRRCRHGIR